MSSIATFTTTEEAIIKLGEYTETAEARRTRRIVDQNIHSIVQTISTIASRENAFLKENPDSNPYEKQLHTYGKYETLKGNSIHIAIQIRDRLAYKMNHCGFWDTFTGKKVGYARLIKQLDAAINQLKAQELPRKPESLRVFKCENDYSGLLVRYGYDITNNDVKNLITHLSSKEEPLLLDLAASTAEETTQLNKRIEGFFETFGDLYNAHLKAKLLEDRPLILARNADGTIEGHHSIINSDLFEDIMRRIELSRLGAHTSSYYDLEEVALPAPSPSPKSPAVETLAESFAATTGRLADSLIDGAEKGLNAARNWLKKELHLRSNK